MNYLGFYPSQKLVNECKEYGTLLTWTHDGHEIIIYYDKKHPFMSQMFAISVALTETYDGYDLFEFMSSSSNDIEVKAEVTSIAQFLLSYKNGILSNPLVKEWVKRNEQPNQ